MRWVPFTLALCFVLAAPASAAPAAFDHTHAAWTVMLGRYVRGDAVDYAAWKATGVNDLDAYLRTLEAADPAKIAAWSRDQQLAYWINAYNAYTVRLVLRHYPVKSIRSIGAVPFMVFKRSFIPLALQRDAQLGRRKPSGRTISLDDIEHSILRERLRDPRIHFAIVCASVSCPTLRSTAFRADSLQAQIEHATLAFVRDPSRNRYDATHKTFYASAIFDWFRGDFEKAAGTVPAFLEQYTETAVSLALHRKTARVEYLPYDWGLNGR
jgi:hypothetical protein